MDFVASARLVGLKRFQIVIRHVLPNVITSVVVLGTLQTGNFILTEATLSFLGVGVPVTQPSLGLLVKNGFDVLFSGLWWCRYFRGCILCCWFSASTCLAIFCAMNSTPGSNKGERSEQACQTNARTSSCWMCAI